MSRFSVIIPTYRRADSLLRALRSVAEQTHAPHEVLVVDNAVQPEVERLVSDFAATAPAPVRYVPEPHLGLHNARHAGARTATGDILVFTDDDATFDPGWLATYARRFAAHPEMAVASGTIRIAWESPPPRWLLDYIGDAKVFGILGLRDLGTDFHLDPRGVIFGGNLAIRREVLFAAGGFNPENFGLIWLGDGETGLNAKLWARGDLIGYVPGAVVFHHISGERMTVRSIAHRIGNTGASAEYTEFHDGAITVPRLARRLGRIGGALGKLGLLTVWWLVRRDRLALLRARLGLAYHLARVRYVLRLSHDRDLRALVTKTNWLMEASRSQG